MADTGIDVASLDQTVRATIGLIERAVALIQDYGQFDADSQQLLPHLASDAESLKKVLQVLTDVGNAATGVTLSETNQTLHADIDIYLRRLERRLRDRTERLAVGRWSRKDLEQLEQRLSNWIGKFQLVYSSIDAELATKRPSVLGPNKPENRVKALLNIFSRLTLADVRAEELLQSKDKLRTADRPSRRMCAAANSEAGRPSSVLVEYTHKGYAPTLDPAEVTVIRDAVIDLAKVLYYSDPDQTRILKCCGYFHDEETCRFGLTYEIPPNLSWAFDQSRMPLVVSLRDLFMKAPRFSLSHRLRFACDVAKAVIYVHLVGWVHKSIRPDNILALEDPSLGSARRFPYVLPRPFLAGFEYARSVHTASDRRSDAEWRLNIYRHPKRQFIERNSLYNMSHDAYSLGVVFLELGLWGSNGFIPFERREDDFKGKSGEQMKEVLLRLARGVFEEGSKNRGVAVQMGDRYEELVRYCLEVDGKEELDSASFVREIWVRLDDMRSALS